ncbi:class I SAM-dependent DNA methyltransferase [Conexibacter arvalis]|uniref:site-specific DNA-methyltransferase (adenine-specific) n=1 Tax=Conexibacter arvalis TaxID=912552 RepID=A0A840IFQ3_9ACTN|nr:class I SAM-dependent DNA methyltransferase [Conexibacter arvalis]MBB4662884.1 hypothetical protein [Conexibacter arvalis]
MNLQEIEEAVTRLDLAEGPGLIHSLLLAYGLPRASIKRLQAGSYNKSDRPGETLWRGKVFDRFVDASGGDLHALIDDAAADERIAKQRPRFLIVRDAIRLLALDTANRDTLDIALTELPANTAFFLPWAGIEKQQLENLHYADVKAAERMARLYDEIVKTNAIAGIDAINLLNVFFARLLFCFFAEDTGVFPKGSFTGAVASLTNPSGEDTASFLDALFTVLNTPVEERAGMPAHFLQFGYVNGSLFDVTAPAPRFSARARSIVIDSGTLDWSRINPDIFGSMMQAVVHPGDRQAFGMHYTSVENILKVIRPLFLDDLEAALTAADTTAKLRAFIRRLSRIRVFDPACGSGNFLVISYKELRRLEHQALQRITELDPSSAQLFTFSAISLDSFYGIEIDGFATEVAMLALWIAKHQMNVEFKELFGAEIPLIPLRESGHVECGNATRMAWEAVCPPDEGRETYLLGNPPYQGGTKQTAEQKADLVYAFENRQINRYLDYVSAWLIKGARFVSAHGAKAGFVATNSVSQGNHVGLLWPHIHETGVEVIFAHAPFRWSNSAKGNAGVTCVVIGLAPSGSVVDKWFHVDGTRRRAASINSYLVPDGADAIVTARDDRVHGFPKMAFGSMPRDGGHLVLGPEEHRALIASHPEARTFIKVYMGSEELLRGRRRYCIWVSDADADEASAIEPLRERFARVRSYRAASSAESTRKAAASPHRFVQVAHKDDPAIMIPRVSSERREVIPVAFTDSGTVISDQGCAVYGADPWLFALLQSRLHTAWVRTVGGKMKTDYRYSATLCYNTFPVPPLGDADKARLTEHTFAVLGARERHAEMTLGDMYLPEKMPADLRRAHEALDETIDALYGLSGPTDEERLVVLFDMYEGAIAAETVAVA